MLSKEEFMMLAKNPPKPDMGTMFVVEKIVINDLLHGRSRHYPSFDVSKTQAWVYTLGEAEELIGGQVKQEAQGQKEVYCYYVREICPGLFLRDSPLDSVSCRLYDNKGHLIDQTYYSIWLPETAEEPEMRYYSIFRGRDESMQRFKDGDIVEWYHPEGFVNLAILVDDWSPTPDACWRSWQTEEKRLREQLGREPSEKEIAEEYFWDIIDDGYTILDGGLAKKRLNDIGGLVGHNLFLQTPRYRVPENIVQQLKKLHTEYLTRYDKN